VFLFCVVSLFEITANSDLGGSSICLNENFED